MTLTEYCKLVGISDHEEALWHALTNEHVINAAGRESVLMDEALAVAEKDPELVEIELP